MKFTQRSLSIALGIATSTVKVAEAACPFADTGGMLPPNHPPVPSSFRRRLEKSASGDGGKVPEGGFAAVQEDIKQLLVDSQEFWPADFGTYGPFMIRLAWHCAGSYRASDGRGGCDGARIRFAPEADWPDNANLDKALQLLEPIKKKYGADLSWGDLIMLTGTTAIQAMGGPSLGFCGGRVDDVDGNASFPLGPTALQRDLMPCAVNGECDFPLGPTTVGLIYVNPEGPMAVATNVSGSAADVRRSFGTMGFNDSETVALIGGGHAFGKTHGACPDPPCGTGNGPDTFTSGFEGEWTTTPTTWSNQYFTNLLNFDWEVHEGPGGHMQWRPAGGDDSIAAAQSLPDILMLTADIALRNDSSYLELSQHYAQDLAALETDFAHSWYRLATRDVGSPERCIGDLVPPPQVWQLPLPAAAETKPDYVPIRAAVQSALDSKSITNEDLVYLAFQCADTYRQTDYSGGCDGARIRFSPQRDWPVNKGTSEIINAIETIVMDDDMGDISMADMIVLAGNTAIENVGGKAMDFCGGRTDAVDGGGEFMQNLAPRTYYTSAELAVRDNMAIQGLSLKHGVALFGRPTNDFAFGEIFGVLDSNEFSMVNGVWTAEGESGETTTVTPEQYALWADVELREYVQKFANSMDDFKVAFAEAWTKLMNGDRYDGPLKNKCTNVADATLASDTGGEEAGSSGAASNGTLMMSTLLSIAAMSAWVLF